MNIAQQIIEEQKKTHAEMRAKGYEPISLFGLMDDMFMSAYHLNDEEMDYLCEHASEEEIDLLVKDRNLSFTDKRQQVIIVNKYKNALHIKG